MYPEASECPDELKSSKIMTVFLMEQRVRSPREGA